MGSTSVNSTNHRKSYLKKKFWKKKNSEKFQKQNLNLPSIGSYLHIIYVIFIDIYIAFTLY